MPNLVVGPYEAHGLTIMSTWMAHLVTHGRCFYAQLRCAGNEELVVLEWIIDGFQYSNIRHFLYLRIFMEELIIII